MVYVDELRRYPKWRFTKYKDGCHLFADTVEELHTFAESFGLMRSWFQDGKHPHYDLTAGKRRMAINNGAVEVKSKDYLRKLKEAWHIQEDDKYGKS